MDGEFWMGNLFHYSAQLAAIAIAAAMLARIFPLGSAKARLIFWQGVLACCLLLPWLQPWQRLGGEVAIVSGLAVVEAPAAPPETGWLAFDLSGAWLIYLIAAGCLFRLAWLAVGLARLAVYRRRADVFDGETEAVDRMVERLRVAADIRLSGDVSGPVTFGLFRPVILLPVRFIELSAEAREAVACHELLHVRRRDWAFTVAEELVRAVLWFHPAVWYIAGQIQLAREQTVDREVVGLTSKRERYVEALLAMAGHGLMPGLAPATLFLKKRHLRARVAGICSEVAMSTKRLFAFAAVAAAAVTLSGWLAVRSFPLQAAETVVSSQAGRLTTQLEIVDGGAELQHRPYVQYPTEALASGIEGDVRIEIEVSAEGLVVDARYIDGPLELRRAALRSVLDWHYGSAAVPGRRIVTLRFRLPGNSRSNAGASPGTQAQQFTLGLLSRIEIEGLSEQDKQRLIGRLPIRVGDPLTVESMSEIKSVVARTDEHLVVSIQRGREETSNETALRIYLKDNMAAHEPPTVKLDPVSPQAKQIRVGSGVMRMKRLESPPPKYPPLARQAKVTGTVKLSVLLGADGAVQRLEVVDGHPLLIPAALDAVKDWKYEPTLLNGEPVEVRTEVDINFTLSE